MDPRAPRLLVVDSGASWSTADVYAGLVHGLEHHGMTVFRYALSHRIDHAGRYLHSQWRRLKKARPDLQKPTEGDIFYLAGVDVLEMALRLQVDFVVVVSSMFFHPDILVRLKQAGLRTVVLFTESPYDLQQELRVAGLHYKGEPVVAGCWTNERSSVQAFRAINPCAGYLPHGWHPERHHAGVQTGDDQVPQHDVVFVGSAFRERIQWFEAIDWTGIDLGLYGMWHELGSRSRLRQFVRSETTVDNRTAAALYRRAKIGLNLYRTSMGWGRKAPAIAYAESLNPRAYELAACGTFHLSDYRAEVQTVFGDRVPTFRTPTEAAALMRVWLADEAGRVHVADQLPACVAEASWRNRAADVIGDLRTLLTRVAA